MTVRRLGRIVAGLALVAIIAVLGALVIVPRLMGWVPLTILTGSMEPTIPTGSQVVIERVQGEEEASELQVGDVITVMPYPNDPTLVTHRIVERRVSADGVSFVTQGDANNTADEWDVTATQIRGEVGYHVPYAGYVASFLDGGQKATGAILAAGVLLTYAAVQIVGAVRRRPEEDAAADASTEPSTSSPVLGAAAPAEASRDAEASAGVVPTDDADAATTVPSDDEYPAVLPLLSPDAPAISALSPDSEDAVHHRSYAHAGR
ncbi:signal peptidase I [Georgenia sp. Z1344]|uniref:signal peptidase I n=1 Tax=Georgenia sp. Z1344 TaxID=3416706 RepID=UPI003CEC14BD